MSELEKKLDKINEHNGRLIFALEVMNQVEEIVLTKNNTDYDYDNNDMKIAFSIATECIELCMEQTQPHEIEDD
tara:strand:- start:200 stop:421 length:222 start_codon:yes stop_codon:yes gene_type:complete